MHYEALDTIVSEMNDRVKIDKVKANRGQTRFILRARNQFMFIEPRDLEDIADVLDDLIAKLEA